MNPTLTEAYKQYKALMIQQQLKKDVQTHSYVGTAP